VKDLPEFVDSQKCLLCEGCCRFAIQDSEWRPHIDEEEGEMLIDCVDDARYLKAEIKDGKCKCLFLDLATNHCEIYQDRPCECRLYPFLLVKDNDGVVRAIHKSCPFVDREGKSGKFLESVKGLKKYFQDEEARAFLRRNRQLIGNYKDQLEDIEILFRVWDEKNDR